MILHDTKWGLRNPRQAYLIDGLCYGIFLGVIIARTMWREL